MQQHSLTVIMPVLDAAPCLQEIYQTMTRAIDTVGIHDYEILIITGTFSGLQNDASSLVRTITDCDPHARHIANPFSMGLGSHYRQGIREASKDYIMIILPYHQVEEASLAGLLLYLGQTGAIFGYPVNPEAQPMEARYISKGYTTICNLLFGFATKGYNGIAIIKREILQKIPIRSDGLVCFVEVKVHIMKSGMSYLELPQIIKPDINLERYRNVPEIFETLGSLGSLFWRINVDHECADFGEQPKELSDAGKLDTEEPLDLKAIYSFASRNSIKTLHQIIVCVAKVAAHYVERIRVSGSYSKNNWAPGFQDTFNVFRIVKGLNSLIGKLIGVLTTADTQPVNVQQRRKRKNAGYPSLTIIMPAYREALNLRAAYESAHSAIRRAGISDYEILIMTNVSLEGTHDGTPEIADDIAQHDPYVRHIPNNSYVGLGFKYRYGVSLAEKNNVMMIPGDGEFDEDSLVEVISKIGEADVIIPYVINPEVRSQERQTASRAFTILCNMLFGLNIRYYNGVCILPTRYVRHMPMSCDNFAYMAEVLVYLLKSGARYIEVPWRIKRIDEESSAFKPESVGSALETLVALFWKINVEGFRIKLSKAKT